MVITDKDLKNNISYSTICSESQMITFVGKFSSIDEAKKRCKGIIDPAMFIVEDKTYIYFSEDRIEEYNPKDYLYDKLKELLLINNMITYNIKEEFDTNKLKYILDNMKEYLELKNLSECIRIDIINSKPQFIYKNGEQLI
jgi:hypothetical protein